MQFSVEDEMPEIRRRRKGSSELDRLLAVLAGPERPVVSVPIESAGDPQRFAMKVRMAAKSQRSFDVSQRVRRDLGKVYLQRVG